MKKVTRKEALELLTEVGNLANVTTLMEDEYGNDRWGTILNNGMVYDPKTNGQRGMSNNEDNAKRAIKQLEKYGLKVFWVSSSYFSWATDEYVIEG